MVSHDFASGCDCLQIWDEAENILNKKPQTAVEGWFSSLGLDKGLTTPAVKNQHVMNCSIKPQTSIHVNTVLHVSYQINEINSKSLL
jgi:hypothetical protein